MLYYFVIFVDNVINYQEFFEANNEDAIKYMGYKEQTIREITNWNKSENNRSIIYSNYYTSENIIKINSEIINDLETNLQNTSKLRGLLIDSFHKLKII